MSNIKTEIEYRKKNGLYTSINGLNIFLIDGEIHFDLVDPINEIYEECKSKLTHEIIKYIIDEYIKEGE